MAVNGERATGDDQRWKREVEVALNDALARLALVEQQQANTQRNQ